MIRIRKPFNIIHKTIDLTVKLYLIKNPIFTIKCMAHRQRHVWMKKKKPDYI